MDTVVVSVGVRDRCKVKDVVRDRFMVRARVKVEVSFRLELGTAFR